jgi:bacteriorhodopsin
MGFAFLPWEKLPPKYRGLPFMILGILGLIGTLSQNYFDWVYFAFSLVMMAIGPIVFFYVLSEEKEKAIKAEDKGDRK